MLCTPCSANRYFHYNRIDFCITVKETMVKLNSRSSRLKRRQHDKRVTAELFRTDCFNTTPHRERVHGLSEPVRELPEQVRESPEPVRESPEPVPEAPEQRTSRFIEDFRDGPSQPSPHLIKSQGEPLDLVEKHFSKQAQREQAVLPRVLVREEVCEQVQRGQELLRRERRRGQQGKRLTAHCAEEQRYICRSNNASESKRKPRRPLLRVHPLSEVRTFMMVRCMQRLISSASSPAASLLPNIRHISLISGPSPRAGIISGGGTCVRRRKRNSPFNGLCTHPVGLISFCLVASTISLSYISVLQVETLASERIRVFFPAAVPFSNLCGLSGK